jgi:hypothetical protein
MTAEQIVAALPKMPDDSKFMAYAALTEKIRAVTDEAQAKRLIDQVPDEKVRDTLQSQLDAARADRSIQMGKLDDARRQIVQITDHRQQITRYVNLALAYNKSGKDADVETARSMMRDAKALTAGFPDTGTDLSDLMELLRGYALIDPETGFKTAEAAVDMINEYSQAASVMSKYSEDAAFRNGEMVFRSNGYPGTPVFRFIPQLQMLGKADLERASQLLDRITRPDVRMIFRLYILQVAAPQQNPTTTNGMITPIQ